MQDSKDPNSGNEYVSNVVAESRERGQVLHEQYSRATSDGSWSKADDGTIRFADSNIEITSQGDVFGPYDGLVSFLKDHGLSGSRGKDLNHMEVSHLVAAETCEKAGIDPKTAPSVAADASGHMTDIHGSSGILAGTLYKDVEHMKAEHRSVYSSLDAPEWGERAAAFIETHRAELETSLQNEQRELAADLPEPNSNSAFNEPACETCFQSKIEPSAVVDCQDSNVSKY